MSMEDTDFEDISTKVECVKIAMNQDKTGFILKLSLNPADTPEDLMRDPVGTRYVAVFVRVDGEDKPVASQVSDEGKKAVALAGALCGDDKFQRWLAISGEIDEATEDAAATWLRGYLNISSRKELRTEAGARKKLDGLRGEFIAALKRGDLLG